ncbi:MAG: hypothetical protein KKC01_03020 [Gammaproteobacteria bacterium]|nr:hypothetical protein [Gammaproteobacteria bacterium]
MSTSQQQEHRPAANHRKRLSKTKHWLLIGGGIVCLLCWLALGIGWVMDTTRNTLIVLVTATAVATEGLFWLAAAVLGVTVFQARRKIWRWMTRQGRDDVQAG